LQVLDAPSAQHLQRHSDPSPYIPAETLLCLHGSAELEALQLVVA
jgi:hypothetical protein